MKKLTLILTLLAMGCAYQSVNLYNATPNSASYALYRNFQEVMSFQKNNKKSFKDDILRQIEVLKPNITSQSAFFDGGEKEVQDLMKKLSVRIVETQEIEGIKIYYGFSTRLRGGIILGRDKINIQIARKDNKITVGTPIIVGSY